MRERCIRIQSTRGEDTTVDAIWKDGELLAWAAAEKSSILLIQGSPGSAYQSQRFSTEMCTYLETRQTTVYMLNGSNLHGGTKLDEAGLLRQLALQALKKLSILPLSNHASVLVDIVDEFRRASTTKDWFDIMGRILKYFSTMSVIVDLDVLGRAAEGASQHWPEAFQDLCAAVEQSTLLRVLILGSRRLSLKSDGTRLIKLSRTARPPGTPAGIKQRGVVQRSLPLHIRKPASSPSGDSLQRAQSPRSPNQQPFLECVASDELYVLLSRTRA